MKKKNYKRKRGPVQAKKVTYDGIKFASGLERYMYQALKKAKIKAVYEGATFEISKGFEAKFSNFVKYTTKTSSDPSFNVESSVSKEPNPRFPTFVYGPTMFNL